MVQTPPGTPKNKCDIVNKDGGFLHFYKCVLSVYASVYAYRLRLFTDETLLPLFVTRAPGLPPDPCF